MTQPMIRAASTPAATVRELAREGFVYQLPTKYLASLDAKRDVAAALAALLKQLGADEYATICRAPEVEEMLALRRHARAVAAPRAAARLGA